MVPDRRRLPLPRCQTEIDSSSWMFFGHAARLSRESKAVVSRTRSSALITFSSSPLTPSMTSLILRSNICVACLPISALGWTIAVIRGLKSSAQSRSSNPRTLTRLQILIAKGQSCLLEGLPKWSIILSGLAAAFGHGSDARELLQLGACE